MDILTPLQKDFIRKFSESPFRDSFFLTGGTALSAFYLKHRFSEDLDFFTEIPEMVPRLAPWISKAARELNLEVEIRRQVASFIGCFFRGKQTDEVLKVDFAQDSPFRHEKIVLNSQWQIYIDNLTDIACNKLSALFDRSDAKDFVDIYFLQKEFMPFEKIVDLASKKHIGIDSYWLAQALYRVERIEKLPRMLKDISLPVLKEFFIQKAKNLLLA